MYVGRPLLGPVSLPPRPPGTTCAQGPGPWGMRQRPLFQLLFSLWMSLISLAWRKEENVVPASPPPEVKRGMVTPGCPRPHLTSALKLGACLPLLQAAGLGAWATRPSAPAFLVCVLLQQLQVNPATRPPEQFPEARRMAVLAGPGPVALFPPPLLHALKPCHGHLFSTGLLICLTRSRPTAFLITANPESPLLPTHNKNHLIK